MAKQKYIVDGTTLKFAGKHYEDGSVVELPEEIAATTRVRIPTADELKKKAEEAKGDKK